MVLKADAVAACDRGGEQEKGAEVIRSNGFLRKLGVELVTIIDWC